MKTLRFELTYTYDDEDDDDGQDPIEVAEALKDVIEDYGYTNFESVTVTPLPSNEQTQNNTNT